MVPLCLRRDKIIVFDLYVVLWSSYAGLRHWMVMLYVNSSISRFFKIEIRIVNVHLC